MDRLAGKTAIITGGEGSIGMAAVARFGRLDVVIANAGIAGATGPVADYPEDAFDQALAVHVRGAFLLAKHAVPHLGRGASVIITSSVVGLTAAPNIAGYSTAKHAQGRHASAEEIARAMLFLASEDSSFVTGTTLAVDGGMSS